MEGRKFDQGKPDWSLLPMKSVEEVVKVLTYGAEKYDRENWRIIPDAKNRYFAATMRHLTAWWNGERVDDETGISHLAHAICCLHFLEELDREKKEEIPARAEPQEFYD